MLPSLVFEPPQGDGWSHEIKYDGYRTLVVIRDGRAQAFTRSGHDWSGQYRPIIEAARQLACTSLVLDGEMIVQDEHGRSDFAALRSAISHHPDRLIFYAFDLLAPNGRDLRHRALIDRRNALADPVRDHDPSGLIQFSTHIIGDGRALFDAADALGLEGIVCKKLGGRYCSGRTQSWVKVKCFAETDFLVVGTEHGDGAPIALLARQTSAGLEYAGSALVALWEPERGLFWHEMEPLKRDMPALLMTKRGAVQWVTPAVGLRVRYLKGSDKLRRATVRSLIG